MTDDAEEKRLDMEASPAPVKALGKTAARGAAYSGLAQGFKILILMTSAIAVARILTPADYGVIAMTDPISGFILMVQNLGLNQALVQARSLSEEQVNTLFFYNLAGSAAVAVILLAIAPLVGLFYGDARPSYVTAASAATVLITGTTLQHTALINRDMRFRALGFIDVAVAASTFIFTLGFALWLKSYWSIWVGTFLGAVVNAVLVWKMNSWRPTKKIAWRNSIHLIRFGANLTGYNILNFLSRNLDNVLIAKVWGAIAVGLYDRSYRLMMFPLQSINTPLSRVMLPILSKVQNEPERFRRTYILAIRAIALCSVPGVMAAAMCSTRLVPFLLGHQWANASPIFFWLSLAAITQPISNTTGWLFIASGRAAEMFQWSLISTPVTIASFILGLHWGAKGVAEAYFFGQVLLIPVLYWWCTRSGSVRMLDLYGALLPTLAGGSAAWMMLLLVQSRLSTLLEFIVALSFSYLFSAITQAVTPGGRAMLRQLRLLVSSSFFQTKVTNNA